MGSGKSTVGPLVARQLGGRFLDLDDVIARRAGREIPAIFEREGEEGFRRREAQALQSVGEASGTTVVATGGGTLTREANLRRALQRGFVVYLRAPAKVLAGRLRAAAATRPLLHGDDGRALGGVALTRRIERLLGERRRYYERAHATVHTARQSPAQTAEAVASAFHAHRSEG